MSARRTAPASPIEAGAADRSPLAALLLAARAGATAVPAASSLRGRLAERVRAAVDAGRGMHTLRAARQPLHEPAPGVRWRELYRAAPGPLRPGEPLAASLVDLAPGTRWRLPAPQRSVRREWLVLQGRAAVDGLALRRHSHLLADTDAGTELSSPGGALLLLRDAPASAGRIAARVEHDTPAAWADFAPGIRRRLLHRQGGEASMLYRAEAGAAVPLHRHGLDEECLLLAGEMFLDDVLLQPLDYQLAPAGTAHGCVSTDTGAWLYAHGDAELQPGEP